MTRFVHGLIASLVCGLLLGACGGGGGSDAAPSSPPVQPDATAPIITLHVPLDGTLTNQAGQVFAGHLSEPAALTINGTAASVDRNNQFSFGPVTLAEGDNRFSLIAVDAAGNRAELNVSLTLDSIAPGVATPGLITRSVPVAGSISVSGLSGSVEAGAAVEVTNQRTAVEAVADADGDGAFSVEIDGAADDVVLIVVRDRAGNSSEALRLEPPMPLAWRFGVIGDSIATATHSNDMCGSGNELLNCLRNSLGQHDSVWSYAAGDKPWTIGMQAGYTPAATISAAADGAEWKDALEQAQAVFQTETGLEQFNRIFIGLGSNDVCAESGHFYGGDLDAIAQHVDNTLTYLTDAMAGRIDAVVHMAGTPDIVEFRNMLHQRQHDVLFTSCQALWDLDVNAIQVEARDSLCKGELGVVCDALPAELENRLLDIFLDSFFDQNDVDEGPCGRVLSGANSPEQRLEARDFNIALNDLLAQKATQYNGRNNVSVMFTNALFDLAIEPYMVSQLDCFHPSRAGQLAIAQAIWQGLDATYTRTDRYFFDAFENPDKCTQEFTTWGGQCWVDGGAASGFDARIASDGWYRLFKDTDNNVSHWVERSVGDVSGKVSAWLSFRHRRVDFDDDGDRVDFFVYDADGGEGRLPGWVQLDAFRGPGVDVGVHNGQYYDLTPFLSPELKVRFLSNNARSMENGDGLQWDNFSIFAW